MFFGVVALPVCGQRGAAARLPASGTTSFNVSLIFVTRSGRESAEADSVESGHGAGLRAGGGIGRKYQSAWRRSGLEHKLLRLCRSWVRPSLFSQFPDMRWLLPAIAKMGELPAAECRFPGRRSELHFQDRLLRDVVSTTDIQFVHLVLERRSFQSEALRRSTLARYFSGGGSKRINDHLPFSLFES